MPTRAKIFVVDDHEIVRDGIEGLIREHADLIVCGQAGDRATALAGIAHTQPDLAIIDLRLGSHSGLELIKDLHAQYPRLRLLAYSMLDEPDAVTRALRAGATGYIVKGDPANLLVPGLRQVLRGEFYASPTAAATLAKLTAQGATAGGTGPLAKLSDRETEIFEAFATGASVPKVAHQLGRSAKTVRSHCDAMKLKLSVRTTRELQLLAVEWLGRQAPGGCPFVGPHCR